MAESEWLDDLELPIARVNDHSAGAENKSSVVGSLRAADSADKNHIHARFLFSGVRVALPRPESQRSSRRVNQFCEFVQCRISERLRRQKKVSRPRIAFSRLSLK